MASTEPIELGHSRARPIGRVRSIRQLVFMFVTSIVLPLGRCDATPERTATGFPIAVQLVARYGGEATLFRLAAQLEKARPWFDRKPLVASDSNSESARSAAR